MLRTKDNFKQEIKEEYIEDLSLISNQSIGELINRNNDLFVFSNNDDEASINESNIFDINNSDLETGNIMGFIGVNNTEIRVSSRFATHDEDYLLHYMLQKVFSLNIFNLNHKTAKESIFDFLIYMFPYYLKKAYRQGLYKEYQKRNYNDSNVKGNIDINRHIKQNIPFLGRISYSVREQSFDNSLTQLIRHTIEYIKTLPYSSEILNADDEMKKAVPEFIKVTPNYSLRDRRSVINKNIRPFSHPFFTEYIGLHRICLQILRHEGLKYGEEKDKVYGVLFDGAWLWEEYVNTFLKKCGFKHPENKSSRDPIYLFENNKVRRYPDFYRDQIVIDAKYKRLTNKQAGGIGRDDMNQIISYMYVLQSKIGGFLVPTDKKILNNELERSLGVLNGYGNEVRVWSFPIPHDTCSYKDFCASMKGIEDVMVSLF
ncbi:McrC family protein [Flammeovirga sp. EKP202]|uniref:McrC family protein n=1 Tax=Flammeovirga sp. EKP202 TaxID=2770592 RepID=UPI00165EF5E9|nr:hypothetical protein [Flammeovirga sp. EKP202]MBD0403246.1 hypothetical protein [Flammeovirga sp. EKP202]